MTREERRITGHRSAATKTGPNSFNPSAVIPESPVLTGRVGDSGGLAADVDIGRPPNDVLFKVLDKNTYLAYFRYGALLDDGIIVLRLRQKIIIWLGVLLIVISFIFPPTRNNLPARFYQETGERPSAPIDYNKLILQFAIIILTTIGITITLGKTKSENHK